jgi:hypothetical protein
MNKKEGVIDIFFELIKRSWLLDGDVVEHFSKDTWINDTKTVAQTRGKKLSQIDLDPCSMSGTNVSRLRVYFAEMVGVMGPRSDSQIEARKPLKQRQAQELQCELLSSTSCWGLDDNLAAATEVRAGSHRMI